MGLEPKTSVVIKAGGGASIRSFTLHYIFSVHLQSRPRTADITMSHNENLDLRGKS